MIYIGLGSNMGNKSENLTKAISKLAENGIHILRRSTFYETAPWGNTEQDSFVNAVIELDFEGDANQLLEICLRIELEMGRERKEKWGPRNIDIDIIDFHRQKIDLPHLQLPHPYYRERDFVMIPLTELVPEWDNIS